MNWNHTRAPVWVTGMNWDELGWTGMTWDGHRSGCGASELSEVALGGLWFVLVILGHTGWHWSHIRRPVWATGMDWDELGWTGMAIGVIVEHLRTSRWGREVFGSYWDGLG